MRVLFRSYLSLRALDERIALAVGTLESRNKGLELAKLRRDAGVTSALDYRQAETLLTQAETELASLRRQHAQTRNALGVLIGSPLPQALPPPMRSEEHTSELQSLMRISSAVFCLK